MRGSLRGVERALRRHCCTLQLALALVLAAGALAAALLAAGALDALAAHALPQPVPPVPALLHAFAFAPHRESMRACVAAAGASATLHDTPALPGAALPAALLHACLYGPNWLYFCSVAARRRDSRGAGRGAARARHAARRHRHAAAAWRHGAAGARNALCLSFFFCFDHCLCLTLFRLSLCVCVQRRICA